MFLRVEYKRDGYNFFLTGECTNNIPVEELKQHRYIKDDFELAGEEYETIYAFRAIKQRGAFKTPKRQSTPSVVVCTTTGKANLYHGMYGDVLDKYLKPVVEHWLRNTNISLEWVEEDEENIVMSDYAYVGP